jgi:hypothetical protein
MQIAGISYGYEHGFGKLKLQKKLNRTIKFKPIDIVRPDVQYIFNLEQLLCIYQALYVNARPFFKNSCYGRLSDYFKSFLDDGGVLFPNNYKSAVNALRKHLTKLFLNLYALEDVWEWRKSLRLTDDMSGFINPIKLSCPPHYNGRHTMPIPSFHSLEEYYNKIFEPKKRLNKKTRCMVETIERFYPVSRQEKKAKPFIINKGITIVTHEPEKYGYFMFRIDYSFDDCKSSKWTFYIHSKPNQSFVDFVIELSGIYEKLCKCRGKEMFLNPVYKDDKDSRRYVYYNHFYIKPLRLIYELK